MPDPILRLDPARLSVEPGSQASLVLTVSNPGTIVEGYSVDVVSTIPMPWAEVTPATLSVYPQQEATAVVAFAPPTGPGAPGGTIPFGVRVQSQIDGGGSAVAEGDLEIAAVSGLQAKLTPIASSGRWSGRHTLKVSNWGNAPARLRISPEDPDQALGFLVSPEVVDVPLGGEVVARLKVRTRHPTLRGAAQRLPFRVACEPDTPQPAAGPSQAVSTGSVPVVDGAFNQKPILTRMVVMIAGLALVAGIGAAAYALTREDAPESKGDVEQADRPTGLDADGTTPGIVRLSWDTKAGVQSYKLKMTAPVDDESEIFHAPVKDDPVHLESKVRIDRADHYCYQLVAVREGAADSAPSEEACVDAVVPAEAPPPGSDPPKIEPIPSPGDDGGSGDGAPPAGEDPLPFISVLKFYPVADPAAETLSENDRAVLEAAGLKAKLLSTDEWALTPPPSQPGIVLYTDGATAAEAQAACEAIRAEQPTLVVTGCGLALGVAPLAEPSPTL